MEQKNQVKLKKKTGRKEKINRTIIDTIAMAVRGGNYIETAAALAGIHKDTLYDWLKKEERGGLYKEFSDSIKKALAESEARDVLIIGEAGKNQWQASAWRLERRFPDKWGRKDKIEAKIEGTVKTSNYDLAKLSTDQLLQIESILSEAEKGEEQS